MTPNPYARFVEGMDLVASLEQTPAAIERLVRSWPRERDERSYAPGKWTARQILAHLAHAEMVFSTRLRFALAEERYAMQPFDQDNWMDVEPPVSALDALDAYTALRRMNLTLCRSLDDGRRTKAATHPQFGAVTVDWILTFFAGHERNHLPQLQAIGEAADR
jgi:uncharacterized damage-inducible protein DinB